MAQAGIWRPISGRLIVKTPYIQGGLRPWLKDVLGNRIRPEWDKPSGQWRVARPHLNALLEALVSRWDEVYLRLDYNVSERCDTRCQEARGPDCTCACLGANHGGASHIQKWKQVGETTLIDSRTKRVTRVVTRADLLRGSGLPDSQ